MITLRGFQEKGVSLVRERFKDGIKRVILCFPTGAGKTVTFTDMASRTLSRGKKVCVICHRYILIIQARDTMRKFGLDVSKIHFGTVQYFVRTPSKLPIADLYIIDECHVGNFKRLVEKLLPEGARVLGLTATPISSSKKNPLNEVFEKVISTVQIRELIEQGFLARPVYKIWECDTSKLERSFSGDFTSSSQQSVFSITDFDEAYNQRVGKTIIFSSSVEQAIYLFDRVNKNDGKVFMVHSKMNDEDILSSISLFKATKDAIMINCSILTAGFDDPLIETVILYRATISLPLYLQMVGRGSRVVNDKESFNIFDLGGNYERHGAWELNRDWEMLFELQGKKVKDKQAAMKKCVNCEAVIYASQKKCPYCNSDQPIKEKKEIKADRVKVINSLQELPNHLNKPYKDLTIPELIERSDYGSSYAGRAFKSSWVVRQLINRPNPIAQLREYASLKGYSKGWVNKQIGIHKLRLK